MTLVILPLPTTPDLHQDEVLARLLRENDAICALRRLALEPLLEALADQARQPWRRRA